VFGEISLSGDIRAVGRMEGRLKEAAKLGFGRAVLPESARGDPGGDAGLSLNTIGGLTSLVADIAARGVKPVRETSRDNSKSTAAEKNTAPARFKRQES